MSDDRSGAVQDALATTDAPNVHHFGRVRPDELPVPFYSFTLLRATDVEGQEHLFYVPTAALAATPARPDTLDVALEAALSLLVENNIHGGLPNGYCAVCQGQCMRTWVDGPKRWDAEACSCGEAAYRPEPVMGRRQTLRCRGCHHIVGRCTCLLPEATILAPVRLSEQPDGE